MARRLALAALLLALTGPTFAAEAEHEHAGAPQKTVVLGRDRILPSDLTMSHSDVLVFENLSSTPLVIRFLEPENQIDKIRCQLLDKKIAKEAGELALFSWDYKNRLVATVAPGRLATLCSLAPGQYSYTVEPSKGAKGSIGAGQKIANKGTLTVQ